MLKILLNFSAESTWNKHCKGKGLDIESKCPKLRMVWVSCTGETLADTEYMGIINYTPRPGYPGYYFPYLNQNHYLRYFSKFLLTKKPNLQTILRLNLRNIIYPKMFLTNFQPLGLNTIS